MKDVLRFLNGDDCVDMDEVRDFLRVTMARNRNAESFIQRLLAACDSYSEGLPALDLSGATLAEYTEIGARLMAARVATACGHGLNSLTREAMK